jgi:hypothetical protein
VEAPQSSANEGRGEAGALGAHPMLEGDDQRDDVDDAL